MTDRTRLTRRGFISMLASVPIVAVAVPRIFLPESEQERDIRLCCEDAQQMQRQLFLMTDGMFITGAGIAPNTRIKVIRSLAEVNEFFGGRWST